MLASPPGLEPGAAAEEAEAIVILSFFGIFTFE